MGYKDPSPLVKELLLKDRIEYIEIIKDSEDGIGSREVTERILRPRGITSQKEIKKENIKVNKRLRAFVDLGILISDEGEYNLSSLGYLLLDSWKSIGERVDTMDRFSDYFNNHLVNVIPKEFFRQIHKLRTSELTGIGIQWKETLEEQMMNMERKLYNLTHCIHDYPEIVLEKAKNGEIEIVIVYQFEEYPELNYSDSEQLREEELFNRLVDAGAEFRYLTLENRRPMGIRIVDEKWASFLLPKMLDGQLDRDQVFIGTDIEFVSWCRDLMYHIWSFEAESLNVEEVIAEGEE